MWLKIGENTDVEAVIAKHQFNEAFNEMRDAMIDHGLYTEADNKMLNWLKKQVEKICPSPEKIGDFFKGFGKKLDKKMQNCKVDWLLQAWNNLKSMANQMGGEGNAQKEPANEAVELYDEGFMDRLKAGWNAFKGAGGDNGG